MKISAIIRLIVPLIWSIFMGVTAVSIGIGALYPPINLISKPFVCPNGQMKFEQAVSNPLPGRTYTLTSWDCVDQQSGAKTELSIFPISLYAGSIYGIFIFFLVLLARPFKKGNDSLTQKGQTILGKNATVLFTDKQITHTRAMDKDTAAGGTLERMKNLKELRAANMISESEYEMKRAEILKEL